MMAQDIQIGSEFEFDGFWWEPRPDGEPLKAQGHLTYRPSDGFELSVVDLHPNPHDFFGDSPQRAAVLWGCDLAGKPCTLFDVTPRESTFYSASGHSQEILRSNRLVHGLHLGDVDDLLLDHATVSVQGLREWANHYWTPPATASDGGGGEPRVTHGDPLKDDVLNVALNGGHLLIQRGVSIGQSNAGAPVNAQFKLDERIPYEEFSGRFVKPLRDLIVLTTRSAIEVEAVTLFFPTETEKWWGDRKPIRNLKNIEVVERTTLTRMQSRDQDFARIPMPLRAWGADAPQIISRWFEQRAGLGGPGNLLFATLSKRDVHLENDVLGLLSVAEGYHRARFDNPPFSSAEHQAALEAMIGALGEQGQVDHYRGRLKHANQESHKQRVRVLYERAEKVLVEAGSWRKQLQGLIDTRNFLTHWHERPNDVLEEWDLWTALNRLRVVIEINLYLDLGVGADVVEAATRTANHGRDFMRFA